MRYPEHIEDAKDECRKLGAEISIILGKTHFIATISINGKHRKISISGSPRKMCSHNVIKDVRRAIRECQQ